MKYFLISSERCGSHYCGEAIALRTQVLPLGECLNSMYDDNVYTFENNQVQVHWPKLIKPNLKNQSSVSKTQRLSKLPTKIVGKPTHPSPISCFRQCYRKNCRQYPAILFFI